MNGRECGIVRSVQAAWADAFAARDVARLAALYAEDAAFYGSAPGLSRGQAGVRGYFAGLSARYRRAVFGKAAVDVLAPGVIAASGPVLFEVEDGGVTARLPYRMTHVLVAQGGGWRIAVHHASPEPG